MGVDYLDQPVAGQAKAASENPVPLNQCTKAAVKRRHINRPSHPACSAKVKWRAVVTQLVETPVPFLGIRCWVGDDPRCQGPQLNPYDPLC